MENFFQAQSAKECHCDIELQAIAKRCLQPTPALQELPLILVSELMLALPVERRQQNPEIRQAIQGWLDEAYLDDERLRIERHLIAHTPIYIPHTLRGRQFFNIAKAIGEIPLNAPLLPKNQNQGYWLKTLHYYWQAKGVALAYQLLGLMPDPIGKSGALGDRLPAKGLHNLRCSRAIDFACLQILWQGWHILQRWAAEHDIPYPFKHPFELFIELQKQDFLTLWKIGPESSDPEWLPKHVQRSDLVTRVALLREGIWEEMPLLALPNKKKQEYLEYLHEDDWRGYWILALQGQISRFYDQSTSIETILDNKHLESCLEAYLEALIQGKELFVDEFAWRGGQPYQKRAKGQKITNSVRRLQGCVNLSGYVLWCDLNSSLQV